MNAFALASGPLPKAGVVVVALLAGMTLLTTDRRVKAATMLGALMLAPALLLADIWHSPQLAVIHRHPLPAAVGAIAVLIVMLLVAALIAGRPALLCPLAIVALPFRVPIAAGASTANLLVPLYFVVAAGSLAYILPTLLPALGSRGSALFGTGGPAPDSTTVPDEPRAGWLERLLAAYVALYALQSLYSLDFEKALQQIVFFYVPFSLLFALLRKLAWTPQLLRTCLRVVVALAVLFALVGFVEYATKTVFLNPKLIAANDVHTYFTVNSVFFDPDIFGRFLALVMTLLAGALLYDTRTRQQVGTSALLALLWAGLLLTLSRSSLGALLVGLATVGALRWKVSRALLAAVAVVAIGAVAIAASPTTFGLNQGLQGASSGRAGLVSGGLHLFADRPVWGYGSGSFISAYRAHNSQGSQTLAASHTIPITVAAEQGLIGELVYLALVLVAAIALVRGAREDGARAAVAAAFLALVLHTLLYADFLEDPATWTFLGVGAALAAAVPSTRLRRPAAAEAVTVPASV